MGNDRDQVMVREGVFLILTSVMRGDINGNVGSSCSTTSGEYLVSLAVAGVDLKPQSQGLAAFANQSIFHVVTLLPALDATHMHPECECSPVTKRQ